LRPRPRGASGEEPPAELLAAIESNVAAAIASVSADAMAENSDAVAEAAAAAAAQAVLASTESTEEPDDEVVALAAVTPRPRSEAGAATVDVESEAGLALAEAGPETAPGVEAEEAVSLVASAASAPAAELTDEPPSAVAEIAVADATPLAMPAEPPVAVAALVAGAAPDVPNATSLDPLPNPEGLVLAAASVMTAPLPEPVIRPEPENPEIVTRMSTSNGRISGVSLGRFSTRDQAERTLITISLSDMSTFGTTTRKVVQRSGGFEANFMGMTSEEAAFACQRVTARGRDCSVIGG
jgi:D-alanyl-D-alanine carboxypeptidase